MGQLEDKVLAECLFYSNGFFIISNLSLCCCCCCFGGLIRSRLQRSGKDFTIMKVLPSGVYEYRFIVDGQWRHAPELPLARDDAGNTFNILDLQVPPFSFHISSAFKSVSR